MDGPRHTDLPKSSAAQNISKTSSRYKLRAFTSLSYDALLDEASIEADEACVCKTAAGEDFYAYQSQARVVVARKLH